MTCRWALLALCAAGCSDVFALSLTGHGDGAPGAGDLAAAGDPDLGDGGGGGGTGGGGGGDGGTVTLPAACARLSCTPATNEGDVQLDDTSGTVSGCHAYDTLTITKIVHATQFLACANSIMIAGTLDANGGGSPAGMGNGAGAACAVSGASGGGHGGAGADPAGCGGGAAFGDMTHPREPGSGGGGSGGGKGGGVLELAAGTLNLLTLIRASGTDGSGLSAGGGSGGSVLIDIDNGIGAGRIETLGGAGFGISAGGGGGGRVAIYTGGAPVSFDVVVNGGSSTSGAAGAAGTVVK